MSLCNDRGLFVTDKKILRLTRKWPEGAAAAALRDIDAVRHKKHRSACRRMNQRFLRGRRKQNIVYGCVIPWDENYRRGEAV